MDSQSRGPDIDRIEEAYRESRASTHWGDCHLSHPKCAVAVLVREVRRLRDGIRAHHADLNPSLATDADRRLHALLDDQAR